MAHHHIAQLNISRLLAPLDAPAMKEFVDESGAPLELPRLFRHEV